MIELKFVKPTVELISISREEIAFSSVDGGSFVYCAVNGAIYESIDDYCAATANEYVSGGDTGEDW